MIKVVKDGRKHRVTCTKCRSVLEYEYITDTYKKYVPATYDPHTKIYINYAGYMYFIKCPICDNEVKIP